ncbi:MAG TPA: VOC family protein [Pyrinomonadaceae bacterium]|jgi:catechol 2,3-dioxygenase-like lactoylglutathione lyase family enzyme|nr:VOC family protein [Pyrinomonadaceae bacterium]
MATIDHIILNVNDIAASIDFYVNVLGFTLDGEDGPFTVIRVSDDFTLQVAPWGTKGNEHYAFAMSRPDFETTFARIKEKGIAYGDSFHNVGANAGAGNELGARGPGPTVYLNDPSNHLIEIRTYE